MVSVRSEPLDGSVPPLLGAVLEAEHRTAGLLDPKLWKDVVEALAAAAVSLPGYELAAASPAGERLVGAMLLVEPRLRSWTPGERVPVLIVDACIAGSAGIEIAAARATALGAGPVEGLVVETVDLDAGAFAATSVPIRRMQEATPA